MEGSDITFLRPEQVLRDEFTCPITRELFVDPVLAADGHTYDREAIVRWLSSHNTSPKTGQRLTNLTLTPNMNLKRLIEDLIKEGGIGLYAASASPTEGASRILVHKKVLTLECLNTPPEYAMSWCVREGRGTFCGGRGKKNDAVFEGDRTVSRDHFQIRFDSNRRSFVLSDVDGSSGSFFRIARSEPLVHADVIRVGKHCFEFTLGETPWLRCISPRGSPLYQRQYQVKRPVFRIGRASENEISLSTIAVDGKVKSIDSQASLIHAVLRVVTIGSTRFYCLKDGDDGEHSRNGTWLKATPGIRECTLHHGTELSIGSNLLRCSLTSTVGEEVC